MAETKSAAQRLCDYANEQVRNGSIYVLGAQGQTGPQITEAWIKYREHYKEANYSRAISLWKKRLAAGYTALCAYDCSGLVVKWLMDNGYLKSDKTANGLYFDACSSIGRSALQAGDLVFKKYATKNRMYHVGIYMGDGTVTHAKGRDDGVVREAISKAGWNRYGRLNCCGDATGYTRLLKLATPYMSGADVAAVQTALTDKGLNPGSIDGYYGPATEAAVKAFQTAGRLEVDGIVGPVTWAALFEEAEPEIPDEPTGEPTGEPTVEFTRNLQYTGNRYMTGDDVKAVQQALLDAGFDPKGVDGSYGPNTVAAVKAFQAANGLAVDGIVGRITWAALFDGEDDAHETPEETTVKYTRLLKNTGKPYMTGEDVKAVQQALLDAGFDPKGVDGSYGPNTEAAVKAYQTKRSLEADGIVGPKTWAKLFG